MNPLTENAGLIVIDVQYAFEEPKWGKRNNPQAEGNIARLLSAWRKSDRPVLHATSLANPGIGFRTGRSWQPNQGGSRSNR